MSDALESVACALCGSGRSDLRFLARDLEFDGGEDFRVVRCQDCGLVYLDPRPSPSAISRYYPSDYYTHFALDAAEEARIYRQAIGLMLRWAPPGRILDIGAGDGAFLAQLRAAGRTELLGLEPDAEARRVAAERRGLDLLPIGFPARPLPEPGLAAISMLETIEHLHEPIDALRRARELLAPGGCLVLSTPNIDGLELRLLGPRGISLQVPRHLTFFSAGTLRAACEAAGLRVRSLETSAATDGLTRSLWLPIRRRLRPAGRAGAAGAPTTTRFYARSWRRSVHGLLGAVLSPLGWLAARSGLGPTIYLVAERPADD